MKKAINFSISSGRSRKGGILRIIPLILYKKSSRRVPFFIYSSIFWLVAEISLTSILIFLFPPTRVIDLSSRILKSFTCVFKEMSAISSKNNVELLAN